MRHIQASRSGFALPVALLAMLVIGALVTGGFYSSSQEASISTSVDLGNQAFYIAEYGLNEALGTWRNGKIKEADTVTVREYDPEEVRENGRLLGEYELSVRKLGASLYLIESIGVVRSGTREARRRVAGVVRTTQPSMPAPTALAIYGGLTVGGNSNIHGNDAGGPGCVQGDTVAGVTAYDSTLVDDGNRDRITGEPPVAEDTSLDTAGLSDFGEVQLQQLIDAATKIYPADPGKENGMGPVTKLDEDGNEICDTAIEENWGDPDEGGPCADYFPVIYAEDDLDLQTGKGQGILIVEGNLKATGNFDFYGVVIVLGELHTSGTGNHLEGSVIVQGQGVLDSESTSLGNSLVQYSRCRVEQAFDSSLRPRPLASRSWMDFTAATRGATKFTGTGS